MIWKLIDLAKTSRKSTYAGLFFTCLLYKIFFSWRMGIFTGWQDELLWVRQANTNNLTDTVLEPDSGYPTPILRLISYLVSNFSGFSFALLHVVGLLMISASVASLAFSKKLSFESRLLVAGCVIAYPSFDLLLFHNISYWTFIPLFVILVDLLFQESNLTVKYSFSVLFLILSSAKPQLLVSIIILLFALFIYRKDLRNCLYAPISISVLLLVLGRFSTQSINLRIDPSVVTNFLLTASSHIGNVTCPFLILVVFRASKYLQNVGLIFGYFLISTLLISFYLFKYRIKESKNLAIILSLLTYVASLYLFPNSGWSNPNILTSHDSISLFSRHYLPVVYIVAYMLSLIVESKLHFRVLILLSIFQNIFMQIALFSRIYKPG